MQANFARNTLRIALKESEESLYAVRGSVWAVLSAIVLSLMSYLLLTDQELSLLDQSEMLYIIASLTVGLGLLVGAILAGDTIAGERERATLESLLLTPIGRGPLMLGKIGAILVSWLLVFVISTPYILVVGSGTGLSGEALLYTLLLGTLCIAGFTALIVGISCLVGSGRSATLIALAILMAMAAPTLLGTVLQNSWFGTIYNALSPFAQVRLALDSAIVDKEGIAAQLAHLGILVVFVILAGTFATIAARRISLEGRG